MRVLREIDLFCMSHYDVIVQNANQLQNDECQFYLKRGAIAVLNKSDQVDDETIGQLLDTFDTKQRNQLIVISCAVGDNIDVFVDKLAATVKEKYVYYKSSKCCGIADSHCDCVQVSGFC